MDAERCHRSAARIEVTGLGLGDQIEADFIPLVGLSYDPKNDVLAVTAEGLEHLISHPNRSISIKRWAGSTASKRSTRTPTGTLFCSRIH
jgi:hypothetical protein